MIYDCITRFFIQDQNQQTVVRGAIVNLRNSFVEALNGRDYPLPIIQLLGEHLTASVLMSSHLKNSARLTIQAKGEGELNLIMAENAMHKSNGDENTDTLHHIRAVARVGEKASLTDTSDIALDQLLVNGQMAITIEPEGGQRYQGIVDLKQGSLSQCLMAYFTQSEQIETKLLLNSHQEQAGGILLQRIPTDGGFSNDGTEQHLSSNDADNQWEELVELSQTLTQDELFTLPACDILFRLFHQHKVTVLQADEVHFSCSCSRQRTGEALAYISPQELETILQEEGEIIMDCEFCSSRYRFSRQDIANLLSQSPNSIQ